MRSTLKSAARSCVAVTTVLAALISFFVLPVRADFEYTPIDIKIPFLLVKNDVDEDEEFDVVIEPSDSTCPAPKTSIVTVKGSGTGEFGITAEEPGTYEYKIY